LPAPRCLDYAAKVRRLTIINCCVEIVVIVTQLVVAI